MKRLAFLAVASLLAAGCQGDRFASPVADNSGVLASSAYTLPAPAAHGLRVMTYNVYLGTDFGPVLTAGSEQEFLVAVMRAYAELVQTDFPARAGKIADQIAAVHPDVVGLQETALWSISSPYIPGGPPIAPFATLYDFTQLVIDSLQARGLTYVTGSADTTSDVAAPVVTAFDQQGNPTAFALVRFQDGDAILVRSGVTVTDPRHAKFAAFIPLNILGTENGLFRGWSSVKVTARGQTVRFVNSHLEAENAQINFLQAQELLGLLESETDPVVWVGDFNSGAFGTGDFGASYSLITASGFTDLWPVVHPKDPGLTNGPRDGVGALNDEGVLVPFTSMLLTTRVDLILSRGFTPAGIHAQRYGFRPDDRTPSGLFPSDHVAVGMVFTLPED